MISDVKSRRLERLLWEYALKDALESEDFEEAGGLLAELVLGRDVTVYEAFVMEEAVKKLLALGPNASEETKEEEVDGES